MKWHEDASTALAAGSDRLSVVSDSEAGNGWYGWYYSLDLLLSELEFKTLRF